MVEHDNRTNRDARLDLTPDLFEYADVSLLRNTAMGLLLLTPGIAGHVGGGGVEKDGFTGR